MTAPAWAPHAAHTGPAITNNCQHFCSDVVQELHRLHPELVSADAVDDVARQGTVITKVTRFLRKR